MQPILSNVQEGPSKGGNEFIDVDEALGYEFPELPSSYDERDLWRSTPSASAPVAAIPSTKKSCSWCTRWPKAMAASWPCPPSA